MPGYSLKTIKESYLRFESLYGYKYSFKPGDVQSKKIKLQILRVRQLKRKLPLYINSSITGMLINIGTEDENYKIPRSIIQRIDSTIRATPELKKTLHSLDKKINSAKTIAQQITLNNKFTELLMTIRLKEFEPNRSNGVREYSDGYWLK